MDSRAPAIHVSADAASAATACSVRIAELLRAALAERPLATLAVSGGSTPRPMFDALVHEALDWTRIHLFFVDERPVPPGDPQSNFTLCKTHLLTPAQVPAASIHRIQAELGPEQAAELYEREIRMFFGLPGHENACFDVIQCGIGPDCHTASLFPGEPRIDDRTGLVAALPVAKLSQTRITMLPRLLLSARHIVILASEPDKAEPLRQALYGEYDPRQFPAQLILRTSPPGDSTLNPRLGCSAESDRGLSVLSPGDPGEVELFLDTIAVARL